MRKERKRGRGQRKQKLREALYLVKSNANQRSL